MKDTNAEVKIVFFLCTRQSQSAVFMYDTDWLIGRVRQLGFCIKSEHLDVQKMYFHCICTCRSLFYLMHIIYLFGYPMEQFHPFHYIKNLRNFTAKVIPNSTLLHQSMCGLKMSDLVKPRNFLYPMFGAT